MGGHSVANFNCPEVAISRCSVQANGTRVSARPRAPLNIGNIPLEGLEDNRVVKQVDFHWGKVRQCALSISACKSLSAATATTEASKNKEESTQTDQFAGDAKKASLLSTLPKWYWTGHSSVPLKLPMSLSLMNMRTPTVMLCNLKRSQSVRRVSDTLRESESIQKISARLDDFMQWKECSHREFKRRQELPATTPVKIPRRKKSKSARRGTILDQAESSSRNAVKRQVIRDFGRSFSLFSVEDEDRSNIVKQSKIEKLQRSQSVNTEPQFYQLGKSASDRRKLEKMWSDAYLGMCNRAVVLNHVIQETHKREDGVTVTPIVLLKNDEDQAIKEPPKDKLFVGLQQQFYDLKKHGGNSMDSNDEHCRGMAREVTLPEVFPLGSNSQSVFSDLEVLRVPFTEDVYLFRRSHHQPIVRLNVKTRSMETLAVPLNRRESLELIFQTTKKTTDIVTIKVDSAPKACPVAERPTVNHALNLRHTSSRSVFKVDRSTQVNLDFVAFSRSESPEIRPVERQIEARTGSEDGLGSMVRCLHFARTNVASRKIFPLTLTLILSYECLIFVQLKVFRAPCGPAPTVAKC